MIPPPRRRRPSYATAAAVLARQQDCVKTDIRGKTATLQQLYIRGNQIVFCIVPSMLRNAPMFARIKQWRKYKGHPPVLASEGAKGQRAAIMRKGEGGAGIRKTGKRRTVVEVCVVCLIRGIRAINPFPVLLRKTPSLLVEVRPRCEVIFSLSQRPDRVRKNSRPSRLRTTFCKRQYSIFRAPTIASAMSRASTSHEIC